MRKRERILDATTPDIRMGSNLALFGQTRGTDPTSQPSTLQDSRKMRQKRTYGSSSKSGGMWGRFVSPNTEAEVVEGTGSCGSEGWLMNADWKGSWVTSWLMDWSCMWTFQNMGDRWRQRQSTEKKPKCRGMRTNMKRKQLKKDNHSLAYLWCHTRWWWLPTPGTQGKGGLMRTWSTDTMDHNQRSRSKSRRGRRSGSAMPGWAGWRTWQHSTDLKMKSCGM